MNYRNIDVDNRVEINDLIVKNWYSTEMIIRGEVVDMTSLDGIVAYDGHLIVGLLTYRITGEQLEILSLDSLEESKGIGTELIDRVIALSRDRALRSIKLITTNDNLNALKFYQKRGFRLHKLYADTIEKSRLMKPSIPLTGDNGIPIRDEIELIYYLD